MERWIGTMCVVLALSGIPGAGAMQMPSPVAVAPPWRVEWRNPFCTLSTRDQSDVAMSIWSVPGSNSAELYLVDSKGRIRELRQGGDATIRLLPNGDTIPAKVVWDRPSWTGVLKLGVQTSDFVPELGRAGQLVIEHRRLSLAIRVDRPTEALQRFGQCLEAGARRWGVNPLAIDALKATPQVDPKRWLTWSDYPQDALSKLQGGTVVYKLTTDPTGKVTDCVVVQSSGSQSMDAVPCRVAKKRAKFTPAIGADGRPAWATFIGHATFKVSR